MSAKSRPKFEDVCYWNPVQQTILGITWNNSAYGWVHECYEYDGASGSWELLDDMCWEPVAEVEVEDDDFEGITYDEAAEFRERVYENELAVEGDVPAPFKLFDMLRDSLDGERDLSIAEVEELMAAA